MTPAELIVESLGRVREGGTAAVAGLGERDLAYRPGSADAPGNPIGWLVWHAARIQDDHVAEVAGTEQVWTAQGFAERFDLPFAVTATGYGQSADEVARLRADADVLVDYLSAVHDASAAYLADVGEVDLDRVVDERWDPPVTLGVRLASVVDDGTQHVGQAAYVRGLLGR